MNYGNNLVQLSAFLAVAVVHCADDPLTLEATVGFAPGISVGTFSKRSANPGFRIGFLAKVIGSPPSLIKFSIFRPQLLLIEE